jgi:hypothetical protein
MATHNDVTGDSIQSKQNSEKFRNNWDLIDWSKKKQQDAMFNQETETKEVKDGSTD